MQSKIKVYIKRLEKPYARRKQKMKDRNMLSSIEFYTLKRYGYYSSFNKQECGASVNYLSNVPSACILLCNKNKALRRFSYILKKVVKKFFFYIIEEACPKWASFFFIFC